MDAGFFTEKLYELLHFQRIKLPECLPPPPPSLKQNKQQTEKTCNESSAVLFDVIEIQQQKTSCLSNHQHECFSSSSDRVHEDLIT
jgi:hypothetical protein